MRQLVLLVTLVSACTLNADYTGTYYSCGPNGECPTDYVCQENVCVPEQPPAPACSTAIAAGQEHACALRADDGTVWCWGRNESGQIGDGSTTDRPLPVQAMGVTGATALSAGTSHTCAIVAGSVMCWGHNDSGQLGDGSTSDARVAVTAMGVAGATAIAAGDEHSCAVVNGGVWCWGHNNSGQLGATGPDHAMPEQVAGLSNIKSIAAGGDTTCAVDTSGSLWCWGDNSVGQLGLGTGGPMTQSTPTQVPGLSGIAGVGVGNSEYPTTCAFTSGGAVYCFGHGGEGEIGNSQTQDQSTPVQLGIPATIVEISVGQQHVCAVDSNNLMWCWGDGNDNRLDNNGGYSNSSPDVALFPDVAHVAAGGDFTCAMDSASSIDCVGDDRRGQLGDGRHLSQDAPVAVANLAGVSSIGLGQGHVCAIVSGALQCWGDDDDGQVGTGVVIDAVVAPTAVAGAATIKTVVGACEHTCALDAAGNVSCWGKNQYGELGDGTNTYRAFPAPVALGGPASQISIGCEASCAIVGGILMCWGQDYNGDLGPSATGDSNVPIAVGGLPTGTMLGVAVGDGHICAIAPDMTVLCWGSNYDGELGNGMTGDPVSMPTAVAGLAGIVELESRSQQTCARDSAGNVSCWGYNGNDNLGTGGNEYITSPTAVKNLGAGVKQVAVGWTSSCVLNADNTVSCWGDNGAGAVGDGTYTNRGTAVPIPGLAGVSDISSGGGGVCAVMSDQSVMCWGDDYDGQLADGLAYLAQPLGVRMTCPTN